jgi:TfoX/Sxy family transcriptional regulator of competence genes
MATLFPYLLELLETATAGLPGVDRRRMFGCDALFADAEIFALVWKTGRIGLKLTDPADFAAAMALPGAEQWHAGPKAMSHWVLVPDDLHDDPAALTPWIRRAHDQASARAGAPAKPAAKPAKTAARANSASKTASKSASKSSPAPARKPAKPTRAR